MEPSSQPIIVSSLLNTRRKLDLMATSSPALSSTKAETGDGWDKNPPYHIPKQHEHFFVNLANANFFPWICAVCVE